MIEEEFKCSLRNQDNKALESSADQPEQLSEPETPIIDDWKTLFQTCLYEEDIANNQSDDQTQANQSTDSDEGLDNTAVEPPENFFPPTAIAAIFLKNPLVGLKFLIGWVLTGIAISMGASFWFDLLSRLVKVRNTGKQVPTLSEASGTQDVSGTSNPNK